MSDLFTCDVAGDGPGQFSELHQFSVDADGNVYGADNVKGRTLKFRVESGRQSPGAHREPESATALRRVLREAGSRNRIWWHETEAVLRVTDARPFLVRGVRPRGLRRFAYTGSDCVVEGRTGRARSR